MDLIVEQTEAIMSYGQAYIDMDADLRARADELMNGTITGGIVEEPPRVTVREPVEPVQEEPVTPVETPTPTEPTSPTSPTTPTTPTTPATPTNPDNGGWPTGWDTPENPDYRG